MAQHAQTQPGDTATRESRVRAEARSSVTLLRHGEPDWTPDGTSVPDPGLTAFGHAQAEAAGRWIAQRGVDAIYVSPYRRSQETAAPLARATGIEPVVVEDLREVGVNVDGLSQEDVDRYFVEASQRPLQDHWEGWPDAERFHEFHARVTGALEGLLAQQGWHPRRDAEHDFTQWDLRTEPRRIVVVAHGGTNAVALTHLLDVRPVPWEWLRFESELATYSMVQARPLGPAGYVWSLQDFGEVGHLVEAGLRSF